MDKEQRRKRTHPPKTIRGLPEDVRKELDERIARRDFKNYTELKRWRHCMVVRSRRWP
jgi:hypothetical protein